VRVLSPHSDDGAAIVTIVANDIDVPTLAARLDKEHGVLTRPGLHCAPEAHRVLGTEQTGAVRFSLGWSSTEADVDHAIDAVAQVTGARKVFAVTEEHASLDTGPDA
jgi:selenocysteine lyase/cysteine desulfurase